MITVQGTSITVKVTATGTISVVAPSNLAAANAVVAQCQIVLAATQSLFNRIYLGGF